MPMYTGLARVARTTGYPVVEVKNWKGRGHGKMRGCKTIVPHHTVGPTTGNYPSLRVVRDGHSTLPGPLSQLGIGRDGTIYVIGAGVAYHAGKVRKTAYSNPYAIGIEAENTGVGEPWPHAQLDSYVKLCRALIDEFKLPVGAVLGHKEICAPVGRKIDPAFIEPQMTMAEFRGYVRRGYYSAPVADVKPAGTTKPKPKPARKAWPAAALPVTGGHTTASHAAWVKLLADVGYKDKSLTTAMQRWLRGLGYYKGIIEADRGQAPVFGPMLVTALQRFLRAKGFYSRAYRIDAKRGTATVKGEIRYINSQTKHYK
ncbi:peptidoglycan recognition protein family protein [Zhihengliuella halotolerans]|uniref:peptidoglycan recognition protein family protein n=1 Tax=Zhihengliuella halotolerans TaxID=370736 RepID=UPI000C803AD7|nr:N-acetylmuramoyl-L-alanine amidase [Zhihengliuella halotolerans]